MIQTLPSGYTSKRTESRDLNIYLYSYVRNSIIHSGQKVGTTQMSISRWMEKQNVYIHTMEYYSPLKRKEILTHATTWMNLEDIMLSEIN